MTWTNNANVLRPVAIALFLTLSTLSYAQVVLPPSCIATLGGDPDLGDQGFGNNPPVNIDLGVAASLIYGREGTGLEGGQLIDETPTTANDVPDGCSITVGQLILSDSKRSEGRFIVRGPTVFFAANGPFNRLVVGEAGNGTLRIEDGGLFDAAQIPQLCDGQFCNMFVSRAAGSDGEIAVDGLGSRLVTINTLNVGQASVDRPEDVGSFSEGTLTVSNGGLVESENVVVSQGGRGSFFQGIAGSTGIVTVQDPGSTLNISGRMDIAPGVNAEATVSVKAGSVINVGEVIEVFSPGCLGGGGTINGQVIWDDRDSCVDPGDSIGTLTINGDARFNGGTMLIEVDGVSDIDALDVSGLIEIKPGTTARLIFGNGFGPSAGDTFQFLHFGAITGSENLQVEVENLLPGFEFSISNGDVIAISDGVPAQVSPLIDVRPFSDNNKVIPRIGVLPVAILTTESAPIFDATRVNPKKLRLGPNNARPIGGRGLRVDIDHDGDRDLLMLFKMRDTGISCGDTSLTLSGQTFSGTSISSSDSITTVKCR